MKVRIALSQFLPTGQTDEGEPTADRIEIKNPDKNEIKTGHGQCCPPTSGW